MERAKKGKDNTAGAIYDLKWNETDPVSYLLCATSLFAFCLL